MSEATLDIDAPTRDELRARADTLLSEGERPAAAETLERAMERDPFDDDSALLAAMLRFELGELTRAAELALEAIRRRPFHPAALNLLGVACLDAGHQDLARKILRRVTQIAPGLEGAKRNLRAARNAPRHAERREPGADRRPRIPRKAIAELLRGGAPRLTVCLVARDADAPIGPSLESFREAAAEAIVVDATPEGLDPEPVLDRGAIVVRGCGEQNAAAWLDAGLRRASGDWVLIADCGDRLPRSAAASLERDLLARGSLYHFVELRRGAGQPLHRELRLLRNAPGVRFTGRVLPRAHACLDDLARAWGLEHSDAETFLLAGERPPPEAEAARQAAEEDLRESPEDGRLRLQRAHLDLAAGRADAALERLRQLPGARPENDIDAEELVTVEARCLLHLQRFSELSERLECFHRDHAPTRNTLFLQGVAARALGDSTSAADLLRRCLEDPPRASFVPPLAEVLGCGLPNMLGAALLDLGELDAAGEAFELSLAREPGNVEARMGSLGLQLAEGRIEPMLHELDALLRDHGDDARVWSLGAVLLGRVPRLASTAERLMDEACRRFPQERRLRGQLGEARLRCGHAERALEAWSDLPLDSPAEQAARFAACLGSGGQPPPVAGALRAEVEREVLHWLQTWWACSSYEVLDRALLDLQHGEGELPGLARRTAAWLRQIGQEEAATRIRERSSGGGP